MATAKEKTKEERIKTEIRRLRRIYRDLDKNKMQVVKSLIENAAYMTILIEDLQADINRDGHIEHYRNGANQYGKKQSEAIKTYTATTRNHATIIKMLADLAPPGQKEKSRLAAMRSE